ncbi:MAG TPA: hypothetical protein VGF48_09540 [Thermoanaerobaculia bacterium]|jgi:hypothetical protein
MVASAQFTQGTRDRDPDLEGSKLLATELQKAQIHWGPVYLLSRFRVADVGYTDVGYLPADDQGDGLTLGVEAPQRIYFVPSRKVILSADVTPGLSYTDNRDPRTQFNYRTRADVHFLFNHLYLDIYGGRSDTLQAQVADINRLATVRETETGVAGEIKYSSRTSALFSARFREITFPENRLQPAGVPLELLERDERAGRFSVLHKTLPRTSLTLAGEYSDYEFPETAYKNGTRTWIGPGFSFDNGRVHLRAEAGPGTLRFDQGGQHEFNGVLGRSLFGYRRGKWTASANVHRDLGFTIFANNNFYIADQAGVRLGYVATRRLSLHTYTIHERDEYPVPAQGVLRRDTISFTAAGFNYQLLRRIAVGLDAGWYTRSSTGFGDEDSGIRYVLHLSYTP